jgi:hypothetical protein
MIQFFHELAVVVVKTVKKYSSKIFFNPKKLVQIGENSFKIIKNQGKSPKIVLKWLRIGEIAELLIQDAKS